MSGAGFDAKGVRLMQLRNLVVMSVMCLMAERAAADTIDGHWCAADGRYLSIQGPQIVTPGGAKMDGDYTRHGFSYVVPAREPGAGETVSMTLVNEQTVHVALGAAGGAPQVWRRCAPPTS